MPTLSGIYTSLTGQTLAIDEHGRLSLIHDDKQKIKLRADAEFWLCEDDGKIGKFGSPKKVFLHFQGKDYHIWVEPRGFSDGSYEYGLIPIEPNAQYSNRFLGLNEEGNQLEILQSWSDAAKFRCIE
ncbi:hypothetical protein ANOM_005450 [Aspergillus nomiae NRRL 13137]|uniref:Uncharacterized protein n=1 Tax=Aspergillus nomiae NRRL (strain ATCC 15546 / NRRL 13137 / CBS 260.88 / M93) TaxID=1509407 RepID=A0A0L1J7G2_ASPN3|nr:uncharacterized protein ANOM_005450 [Aspergillus nomiae NRRL 13137]KNG87610.1 hypothetical protein ANOM_005450 [Aspergillus nomiae NRRL 13137]